MTNYHLAPQSQKLQNPYFFFFSELEINHLPKTRVSEWVTMSSFTFECSISTSFSSLQSTPSPFSFSNPSTAIVSTFSFGSSASPFGPPFPPSPSSPYLPPPLPPSSPQTLSSLPFTCLSQIWILHLFFNPFLFFPLQFCLIFCLHLILIHHTTANLLNCDNHSLILSSQRRLLQPQHLFRFFNHYCFPPVWIKSISIPIRHIYPQRVQPHSLSK